MSDVDVIVLDWNGGERLSRCLESIAAQTLPPARVIVFDNGSQPPTDASLPGGSVLILRSDENLGFTGGINEAMRRVDAPFVAWVNNDVVLDREWLASVRALFDRDPRLAAAQTILRGEGATIDGAGVDIASGRFLQAHHGEPDRKSVV
jgi:Predicted glycosyltransferases